MTRERLDKALTERKLVISRSQAESWIRLGKVTVNGKAVTKPGFFVDEKSDIRLTAEDQYVSRAGLKLASVADIFKLDFRDEVILDVGSSTGGFTDYALRHGASKVYAVDVGTDQLHPSLIGNPKIELHEKTDIRDVRSNEVAGPAARSTASRATRASIIIESTPDLIVIDVSFISLREILPHIHDYLSDRNTQIVAMLKPQFEAGREQVNKGIIKNDAIRRQILKDFETWAHKYFVIIDKRDSGVAGAKGNQERFYLLRSL